MKGYREILRDYPLGWYSLLSFSRMREVSPAKARKAARKDLGRTSAIPAFLKSSSPPAKKGDAQPWAMAHWMARLGLANAAWDALRGQVDGMKSTLWSAARILHRAGAFHLSHGIMRRKLPAYRRAPPNGKTELAWKISYPTPFPELVKRAARAEGIEAELIWGVMREESSFKPAAESFANAVGLLQLIMPTARHVARAGDGRITRKRLTQPALNIKLGARYLAEVGQKTGSTPVLWPAGYNAGTGALQRWLKQRSKLPLDLFVEAVPYAEARGYIKRVNASWATYRYLYTKTGKDPLPYIGQRLKPRKSSGRARKKLRKKRNRKRRRGRKKR
jgi:soluble lytic murein transglycosylase